MQNEQELQKILSSITQPVQQKTGLVQRILEAVAQAAQVGLSQDPSAALASQLSNIQQRRQGEEQRRAKAQELGAQFQLTDLSNRIAAQRQETAQIASEQRQQQAQKTLDEDRFMREQKAKMGDRMFELKKEELRIAYERKKAKEAQDFASSENEKKRTQETKEQVGKLATTYMLQGATPDVAKEIAEFNAGTRENISERATKTLSLIAAKQERLARLASGQGAGEKGLGAINSIALLSDGQYIEADKIKYNDLTGEPLNLPKGVTVARTSIIDKFGRTVGGTNPAATGETAAGTVSGLIDQLVQDQRLSNDQKIEAIKNSPALKQSGLVDQALQEFQTKSAGSVQEQPSRVGKALRSSVDLFNPFSALKKENEREKAAKPAQIIKFLEDQEKIYSDALQLRRQRKENTTDTEAKLKDIRSRLQYAKSQNK